MQKIQIVLLSLAALFVIIGTTGVSAQQGQAQAPNAPSDQPPPSDQAPPNPSSKPAHAGNGQKRLEVLSSQLNLTDEQKENIAPILKNEAVRIRAVRTDSSLSPGEMRQKIATIHRNSNQHIAQFLTPDQKRQWREIRQERRAQGAPQGQPVAPTGAETPSQPAGPANPPSAQ